jgi:uncharacterized protein
MQRNAQFQDVYPRLYPERIKDGLAVKNVTFVVTKQCNLRCTYCYEQHKGSGGEMSLETAKKTIDMLFENDMNDSQYINSINANALILEFIGGEPLLEIDLIDDIVEYFKYKAVLLNHRWAINYMLSMTTNGVLYLTDKVQDFIERNYGRISITITIDGNKELHDSCRKFPDGSGSYDIVERSYRQYLKQDIGERKVTKLTISPDNIIYLNEAVIHLFNIGLNDVHANCVFEKGWTLDHAKVMYEQMKKLADYIINNGLEKDKTCSLFEEYIGKPMGEDDNENWCGGTGKMLAIDNTGNIYPCMRYIDFSLKEGTKPIVIGNINDGIGETEEYKNTIVELEAITRKSQSTDKCFDCPIASGCAWCSAYNYEETGTVNKRVTYICVMHKARCMANSYFWNTINKQREIKDRQEMNIPKDWALDIVSEEEYNMLIELSKV